jgi:hypothetical protein
MAIIIKDISQLGSTMTKLQKELENAGGNILELAAKDIQRGVRQRAPVGRTGSLKKTQLRKFGPRRIQLLGPGHWSFINAGVAPNKMLPLEFARAHVANPGSTAGKTAKIPKGSIDGWFYAGYTGGKGFVDNSISSFEKRAPRLVSKEINRILKAI